MQQHPNMLDQEASNSITDLLHRLTIHDSPHEHPSLTISKQLAKEQTSVNEELEKIHQKCQSEHTIDQRLFNNMLLASFCLLDLPERNLWKCGIKNWHQLLANPSSPELDSLTLEKKSNMKIQARQLLKSYYSKDYKYFWERLAGKKWRMLDSINEIAYFDIETTGLRHLIGKEFKVTSIVLFDGEEVRTYVNGVNLQQFKQDIRQYKAVVTFNGDRFDLPETAKELGIDWEGVISFDLMKIYREFEMKGGLKKIKQNMGITHPVLKDVNGLCAPTLWKKYVEGDPQALKVLLAYNAEDVIPMRYMTEYISQLIRNRDGMTENSEEQKEINMRRLARIHEQNTKIMEKFLQKIEIDLAQVKKLIEKEEEKGNGTNGKSEEKTQK